MARLLADADVFITGNVGATNDKLGLDYESVKAIKPDIVYCQATGYRRDRPVRGSADARADDGRPRRCRTHPRARRPGLRGGHGRRAGCERRCGGRADVRRVRRGGRTRPSAARTGEGCYLDVSCADAVLASQWLGALPTLNPALVDPTGPHGGTGGGAGGPPSTSTTRRRTGSSSCSAGSRPKFWDQFCRAVGREDMLGDHRRDLVVDFGGGEDDLRLELQKIFHTKTLAEWMQVAVDHDIAMGPAVHFDEIQDDPHLVSREMVVTEHHPLFGDLLTLGNPLVVPGEHFTVRSAPAHGEHTDEILAELGYDDATRDDLRRGNHLAAAIIKEGAAMSGILEGLRVVDCSWGSAGPQATGLLADYGAEVVWVEPPGGDPFRRQQPAAASVYNRGKRSIVLDLKDPTQHEALVALTGAPTCSSRVGGRASPSVSVSTSTRCTRVNPGLVYCSISGFGPDGPVPRCRRLRVVRPRRRRHDGPAGGPPRRAHLPGVAVREHRRRAPRPRRDARRALSPSRRRRRPARGDFAPRRRARVPLDDVG